MKTLTTQEREAQRVRDWLLAILRFAITLDDKDRVTVLAMAGELDRPGMGQAATAFAFFTRTSTEFCNAIADKNDPNRIAVLRRQLARIDDYRLRCALEAAIDIGPAGTQPRLTTKYYQGGDLWRGLPKARNA